MDQDAALLAAIGRAVKTERERHGWTRAELAERSELSVRFLGQVEAGSGNIAVTRLARLARALDRSPADLLASASPAERRPVVALVGLRGAGKSTLGRLAADRLGLSFAEHDELVADREGIELGELFLSRGEDGYREAARGALRDWLGSDAGHGLLAVSGGIVRDGAAFERLLAVTHTVWLDALPDDHWERVVAQGDRRPMRDRPDARRELEQLWASRRALYERAGHRIDTSALGFEGAADRLVSITRSALAVA